MKSSSIQEQHFPDGECFGCGPSNPRGMKIRSIPRADGAIIACWEPRPEHSNGASMICGGVLATIMDCHGAATAVHALPGRPMLTKHVTIEYLAPTPMREIELVARVLDQRTRSVEVEVLASAGHVTCAKLTGVFVAPRD